MNARRHNRAFRQLGLNACYIPFRVPKEDLHSFMDSIDELGIQGISITIPHKTATMDYCTQAESSASGIGANSPLVVESSLTGKRVPSGSIW